MLIWLMWNQGVSVNAWRHRINAEFQGDCCFFLPSAKETILHRFWSYPFCAAGVELGYVAHEQAAHEKVAPGAVDGL
jgi:hypothetical protein